MHVHTNHDTVRAGGAAAVPGRAHQQHQGGCLIEAGQYPFASCVRLKEDGERVFEISKVLFDKWVAERVVLQPGDPGYQVPLELCPQHTTQEAS